MLKYIHILLIIRAHRDQSSRAVFATAEIQYKIILLTGSTLITSRALVNKDEISSIAWITYYNQTLWAVYSCDLVSLLTV